MLFRTEDGGQSWTAISPDLTRNDKTKQQWSGGPITGDNTGVEYYCTIFAVAESPREKGLHLGRQRRRPGARHPRRRARPGRNVTADMPGFPEWGTVSLHRALALRRRHRLPGGRRPPPRRRRGPTSGRPRDYGKTWKRLAAALPQDVYLHAVREDPERRGCSTSGTERGVVVLARRRRDLAGRCKLNLPTVAVHDLVVKGDDLVVGTHGRSIWILDDLDAAAGVVAGGRGGGRCTSSTAAAGRCAGGRGDAASWQLKGAGREPPDGRGRRTTS